MRPSKASFVDWEFLRFICFVRNRFTCKKCHHEEKNERLLKADHIIPIARGGKVFDLNNLQTCCAPCHELKTKQDIITIAKLGKEINTELIGYIPKWYQELPFTEMRRYLHRSWDNSKAKARREYIEDFITKKLAKGKAILEVFE